MPQPPTTRDQERATQLDFLLGLFRPLLTTAEAAFILDECSDQHVRDLVDEGRLLAVNVAASTDTRPHLRIWRYSVEHRVMVPLLPITRVPVDQIIPHHRPTILRRELAAWIGCTEQHVSNLNLPGPRGAGDARHRIHRSAVVEWLTTRDLSPHLTTR